MAAKSSTVTGTVISQYAWNGLLRIIMADAIRYLNDNPLGHRLSFDPLVFPNIPTLHGIGIYTLFHRSGWFSEKADLVYFRGCFTKRNDPIAELAISDRLIYHR